MQFLFSYWQSIYSLKNDIVIGPIIDATWSFLKILPKTPYVLINAFVLLNMVTVFFFFFLLFFFFNQILFGKRSWT